MGFFGVAKTLDDSPGITGHGVVALPLGYFILALVPVGKTAVLQEFFDVDVPFEKLHITVIRAEDKPGTVKGVAIEKGKP